MIAPVSIRSMRLFYELGAVCFTSITSLSNLVGKFTSIKAHLSMVQKRLSSDSPSRSLRTSTNMAAFRFHRLSIPAKVVITALMLVLTVTTAEGQCSIPCESITIPACQGLSYTQTGFPNNFNHDSQAAAISSSYGEVIPVVVSTGCYAQSKELLCGALVPECVDNGLILPTKAMCNAFLAGCSFILQADPTGAGRVLAALLGDCSSFADAPDDPQCVTAPPMITIPPVSVTTREVVTDMGGSNMTCNLQCEEIPAGITDCAPQTTTGFPNIFGHTTFAEADEFLPYIGIAVAVGCYAQSKDLLCGALVPECRPNEGLVYPIRSQCEGFLQGCETFYLESGGPPLDCTILPVSAEPMCVAQPTTTMIAKPTTQASTTKDDGLDKCPNGMAKCAGISINQSHVFLLIISFMVILIMQQLN